MMDWRHEYDLLHESAQLLAAELVAVREERDRLRDALRIALDCKGWCNGTVSQQGGYPAICLTCADTARAALAVSMAAGEETS